MEKAFIRGIEKLREYRSRRLQGLGKFCVRCHISANMVTGISLLAGLTSMYFLFIDYWYFLIFAILHLLLDSLDGVIARLTKPSTFGEYFDWSSDSIIAILLLAKVGWYLNDIYPYIIAGLFALGFIIFLASRLKAPLIFIRTASLLVLAIVTIPAFPAAYQTGVLTVGYLIAGAFTAFSLAKQVQWFMRKIYKQQ